MSSDRARAETGRGWLVALSSRLGIGPVRIGLLAFAVMMAIFIAAELLLGRSFQHERDDIRVAVTHIFVASYLFGAVVHADRVYRRRADAVSATIGGAVVIDTEVDRVWLRWATVAGFAVGLFTTAVSPGGLGNYDPSRFTPEIVWHRVLGLLIAIVVVRLVATLIGQSIAFSRAARALPEIDLLDPSTLAPFTRQGLTNVMLLAGFVATFSFFLVEPAYLYLMLGILASLVIVALVGLLLPLLGARDRIRSAKRAELAWCRGRLRDARAGLERGSPSTQRIHELVAWEARIEGVRDWPLDSLAFSRLGLYLLMPLASWFGGALVERLLDALVHTS